MENIAELLAKELNQPIKYVQNIISLLDDGNTIPFIARYRKEMHGTMDDQTIRLLSDRLTYLRNLDARREEIKLSITEQEKMTEELSAAIEAAETLAALEDLYRPYRPKRRTRASIAREKGLEPLANQIKEMRGDSMPLVNLAAKFIDSEKEVLTAQDALAGASDIIAEDISDDAKIRSDLRLFVRQNSIIKTTLSGEEDTTYTMYHDFSEATKKIQSHRVLAINRGEKEGKLKVSLEIDDAAACVMVARHVTHPKNPFCDFLRETCADAWNRLLSPSLEREIRNELTDTANEQAIKTFALNLRPLLMQPPVKNKITLGFDPAYRTGCKLAVVDETGKVLETAVIYPTAPHNKIEEAKKKLQKLCDTHHINCIAIGNGTASKESEIFVADFIKEYKNPISYMVVSEAGASVYSASKLGAEEFPEYDVSLRSAVSIARRLQDPLAELVKIDPKSIGVGQYQHDMPAARLSETLGGVVEDCVNAVGVDLNTASPSLLSHVAGISGTVSKNITSFRDENGAFVNRKQLLKVKGLGPKAYEQCAGFLRVSESENILDHTSVHPESYDAAKTLLLLCGYSLEDIKNGNISELSDRIHELGKENVAERCNIGVPTLMDIVSELKKPGRDPRDELPAPLLRTDVLSMEDLKPGMKLTGTVRNVCDFGVFVDIGVHQDGLVHLSQICNRFIKHPSEAVTLGDIVEVSVISVEQKSHRIALTMKDVK